MIENVLNSLAVLLLVIFSSFALTLPLLAIVKEKNVAIRYAIPFSISVEIIIGYFFYCTNTVRYFPLAYLIIVIVSNLVALRKLWPIRLRKPKIKQSSLFLWLVLCAAIVYTRYYDAFSFVSPGSNDTFYHIGFVRDLSERGYLSNGFYAPGFHLFMMPISKLIPFSALYRFAGPAIGLATAAALILLIKDYLKNKYMLFLFAGLLSFPIYNQLTLQTIGFFSSALTFVLFASFIILTNDAARNTKRSFLLFSAFSVCLALTVPYLFITLIPAWLVSLLVLAIFKRKFGKNNLRFMLIANLILVGGFFVSLGHVFIQSSVLERYYGFPNVQVASDELSPETEIEGFEIDSGELTTRLHLPKFITDNSFLNPIMGSAIDAFKTKNIRLPNNVLSVGGYLWIAFSIFLVVHSIRQKNVVLFTIATCSIAFGIATQTGALEISTYRGRSGWYLLLLSLMGIVLFLDGLKIKKISNWFVAAGLILAASSFIYPPTYYRPYYEDEFKMIKNISKKYPDRVILVVAKEKFLRLVAANIETLELSPDNLGKDNTIVIIEKKIFKPHPVFSQIAVSTDKNFSQYNKRFEIQSSKLEETNKQIVTNSSFPKFAKTYEDDNFEIYSNIK